MDDKTVFKILDHDSEDYTELLQACEEIGEVVADSESLGEEEYFYFTQT